MVFFKTKRTILKDLLEKRALPMGRQEFETWSTRIIQAAMIPGATVESQQFALADMLMHIKPTEAFECDGYFVNSLRKFAVNQVADAIRVEIRGAVKARLAKEENENKVLAN